MAKSAVIGSLRVNLGLESAKFQKGLRNAQTSMQRFSRIAKASMAAVAVSATAAATAMGFAVTQAANHADQLSKTARRIGTTTEALSRLEWSAKLSGVSLSELSTGMQRLSRNMLDVAQGAGGTAKRAFDALGISVTDANGGLRDSSEVMRDVADRFSKMEDSAEKTGLAMALFGRSGAQLITLLNEGRDGLKAMADESDRLGQTISTKTGIAAERFNDTMTRIQAIMSGVVNKIMAAVLPALQNLANTLNDPKFAEGAVKIAQGIVTAMDLAAQAVGRLGESLRRIGPVTGLTLDELRERLSSKQALLDGGGWLWSREGVEREVAELEAEIARRLDPSNFDIGATFDNFSGQMFGSKDEMWEFLKPPKVDFTPVITGLGDMDGAVERSKGVWQSFKDRMVQTQETMRDTMSNIAGDLQGIFSKMFKDSKAAAIAQAILSTYKGISKSLEAYPWPFAGVMAGLHAAAGLAQVARIKSTTENTTSASVTGLSGGGGASTAAPQASAGEGRSVYINLNGGLYTDTQMRSLIDRLNDVVGKGARIQVAPS